jgi:beta-glucanase (GH16 family)
MLKLINILSTSGGLVMTRKILFRFLLICIVPILFSCESISDPEEINDTIPSADYKLIWSEEFNQESTELDPTKWNIEEGYGQDGWGNDEWQLYTNSQENVRVEDGNLIITTKWDSDNYANPGKRDGSITSGRINTKDKFSLKYGKIQARIKPPRSAGMWPAFWMLGSNYDTIGWPQCGEIDIMEMSSFYHNENTTMCTIHWEEDGQRIYYGTTKEFDYSLAEDFHIFEVEWDAEKIVGRIDNITYFVKTIDQETMSEFQNDFFIILNNAVGGNLGGAPDNSTDWPQEMLVDWVRAYQLEDTSSQVETIGIFTDETDVDANLVVGADAEIYVWENTLSPGSIEPYEGSVGMTWLTTGVGWFGGGIKANQPLDLSNFEAGYLNFMIKMPAAVTFEIGINDINGGESFVSFPANETAYGLTRDGEWGRASIPMQELASSVDLHSTDYVFMFRESEGIQCHFAIDDIYYSGGGSVASNISLNASSYPVDSANASFTIIDEGFANSSVMVTIDNSLTSFDTEIELDANGNGSGIIEFVAVDGSQISIEFVPGANLTVSFTDSNNMLKSSSAFMEQEQEETEGMGIFSETHTNPILSYSQIINSADWSGNIGEPDVESTEVTPLDGSYVLAVDFIDLGADWGGIAFDFSSTSQDASAYNSLNFAINKSQMTSLVHLGIKFEDQANNETEIDIASFTPEEDGDWMLYSIPMTSYSNIDFTNLKYLGVWSPKDAGNNLIFGKLFLDNIYLSVEDIDPPDEEGAGIYSESHITTTIPYNQIINSADWSGNIGEPNIESTDVTPIDGVYVLSVEYTDLGAGWGGIAFDFGNPGPSITDYSKLVFSLNKSAMPTLEHLGIKLEDNSGGDPELDIADYTPTIDGDWAKYEIPLTDFSGLDLTNIKYLGIWNPQDSSNSLLFGKLYLDDIHLTE